MDKVQKHNSFNTSTSTLCTEWNQSPIRQTPGSHPVGKNGTHQLLVYADDVNLLGDSMNTIKENIQTLSQASRDIGLDINTEKTKYMIISRHSDRTRT
jgi:hypothetical protein